MPGQGQWENNSTGSDDGAEGCQDEPDAIVFRDIRDVKEGEIRQIKRGREGQQHQHGAKQNPRHEDDTEFPLIAAIFAVAVGLNLFDSGEPGVQFHAESRRGGRLRGRLVQEGSYFVFHFSKSVFKCRRPRVKYARTLPAGISRMAAISLTDLSSI